jgi:hypothetical protein
MYLPLVISNILRHIVAFLYLPRVHASTKKDNICNVMYTEVKGAMKSEDNNMLYTSVRVDIPHPQRPYSL